MPRKSTIELLKDRFGICLRWLPSDKRAVWSRELLKTSNEIDSDNVHRINITRFFRHPQDLRLVIRKIDKQYDGKRTLRICSLGCSSGQEIYTLAMMLEELGAKYEIKGYDIAKWALLAGKMGIYPLADMRKKIPRKYQKHFVRLSEHWGEIRPEIRKNVEFIDRNLYLKGPPRGRFDVIFCRNMLYYWEDKTSAQYVSRLIRNHLRSDGMLVLSPNDPPMKARLDKSVRSQVHALKPYIFQKIIDS